MVVFQWTTGYIVVYPPDNWLYSSFFPRQLLNFFFSPPVHLCRHIYNWNTVSCDVNKKIHTYTPITKNWLYSSMPPLKLAIKLLYSQRIGNMVVFQLKTGYIAVYPLDNWLYSSLSPRQLLHINGSPITENLLLKTDYIVVYPPENWLPLCSSLSPIHLLNGSPISENWLYSSISPLNWLYSYLFPRQLVIW